MINNELLESRVELRAELYGYKLSRVQCGIFDTIKRFYFDKVETNE